MLAHGQSNVFSYHATPAPDLPSVNSRVRFWQEDLGNPGSYSLVVPDLTEDRGFVTNALHVGTRGNSRVPAAWIAADAISRRHDVGVDVLLVGKGGTGFNAGWSTNTSPVAEAILDHAPGFKAATGSDYIDCVLWMGSETDAAAGAGYASTVQGFLGLKDRLDAAGVTSDELSLWLFSDLGDSWGAWNGIFETVKAFGGKGRYISTAGLEEDTAHFLPQAQREIGRQVAEIFSQGRAPIAPPPDREPSISQATKVATGGTQSITVGEAFGGRASYGYIDASAVSDDGAKHWQGRVRWRYATDGVTTHQQAIEIVEETGESGFTVQGVELYGPAIFCLFQLKGPAGDDWRFQCVITTTSLPW